MLNVIQYRTKRNIVSYILRIVTYLFQKHTRTKKCEIIV